MQSSSNELNTSVAVTLKVRSPTGVEHSGEGIYGCRSHNAKLFELIEHTGIWEGIKCKQTNATASYLIIPELTWYAYWLTGMKLSLT